MQAKEVEDIKDTMAPVRIIPLSRWSDSGVYSTSGAAGTSWVGPRRGMELDIYSKEKELLNSSRENRGTFAAETPYKSKPLP